MTKEGNGSSPLAPQTNSLLLQEHEELVRQLPYNLKQSIEIEWLG